MKVPKIQTTEGEKPMTILPDEELVNGFDCVANMEKVHRDARLFLHEWNYDAPQEAGKFLRKLFEERKKLIFVSCYDKSPQSGEIFCNVTGGSIYVVPD